jgi:hypothetical protein
MERFRQPCQNEHRARAGKCRVSIGRNVLLVRPLVESTLHAYSMQPAYTVTLPHSTACEAVIRAGQLNIQAAPGLRETIFQTALVAAVDPGAPVELALLQNETHRF